MDDFLKQLIQNPDETLNHLDLNGAKAVIKLLLVLVQQNEAKLAEQTIIINALSTKVATLERRLNLNSTNSSMPSSSDPFWLSKKPKSNQPDDLPKDSSINSDTSNSASSNNPNDANDPIDTIKPNKKSPDDTDQSPLDDDQDPEETDAPKPSPKPKTLLQKLLDFQAGNIKGFFLSDQDLGKLAYAKQMPYFNTQNNIYQSVIQDILDRQYECIHLDNLLTLLNNDVFQVCLLKANKRGAQHGHKGSNLKQIASPDHIKQILPSICDCGCNEFKILPRFEKKQEFDIEIKRNITEYQIMRGKCTACGEVTKAHSTLPHNAFYGETIKAYAVWVLERGMMSYERIVELFDQLFGMPISEGSINNWRKELAGKLVQKHTVCNSDNFDSTESSVIEQIKTIIRNAVYIHPDETTYNIAGSRHWVHTNATPEATLLTLGANRGNAGIAASGILPDYDGFLIADGWVGYKSKALSKIKGIQACLAHLFRYFNDMQEHYAMNWAHQMGALLKPLMKQATELHGSGIDQFPEDQIECINIRYDTIMEQAQKEISHIKDNKHPACKLVRRLSKDKPSVLLFLKHAFLPTTNNMGERSFRMLKTKQKISGTVLSAGNAAENLNISSFVATMRKQKMRVIDGIKQVFENAQEFVFKPPAVPPPSPKMG